MGLTDSLRALVGEVDAGYDDDAYDEPYVEEDPVGSQQARERHVRPLAPVRPPHLEVALVVPREFEEAQQIADRLRANAPVIVDMGSCGRELEVRLIDFCSGLSYALEASLSSIGERVVLLAPHEVELTREPLGGPDAGRFFNQV